MLLVRQGIRQWCRSRFPGLNFWRSGERPVVLPGTGRGCVVISYLAWPLRSGWDSPEARGHTNAFEVVAMAEAWQNLGFRVEVIDYENRTYQPPQDCRVAVDLHGNLEHWASGLPGGCRKILHATGAHWLQLNQAEMKGLAGIRERKGIALKPRRQVSPSRALEVADHVVVLGNKFTADSFAFGGKPVTRVPISSAYEFPWPSRRNFEEARKRFFWVASFGMAHRGLDLVLEAFAAMPELQLTVCGRPEKEEDFYDLYRGELESAPNIHFHGWVDMAAPEFLEMANRHATIIYPSHAEGGAGSVIHCMHAGMLPVCTEGASVDLEDFGVLIRDTTVEAVREAAQRIAAMSVSEVESRARMSWEHVRRVHTREEFRKNYQSFAKRIANSL